MLFTKSEQVYLQKRPQPAKPHNNKMEEKHILIIAHQTDLKKKSHFRNWRLWFSLPALTTIPPVDTFLKARLRTQS